MHIIWKGKFHFQIVASRSKGEQVKIDIDSDVLVDSFLIKGPGEYEIKDIFVQGLPAASSDKTIYIVKAEEMRLCHLGDFEQKELSSEQLDEIGEVDILMIPADASKVISQIEPRIVIPMNYTKIDKFLKEMGRKSVETLPKLLIKRKDLPQETKIVVLKP